MKNTYTLLFYVKRTKINSNGKVSIYLRITVNGKRAELSINRKVDIDKWNSAANKVKGYSKEAQEINSYIDSIKLKINKIHQTLLEENKVVSSKIIQNIYQGKNQPRKMVISIFEEHNRQLKKLVGKEYAPGTLMRYETAKRHIEEFLEYEFNATDYPVREIDHKFISSFEYFLKSKRNCAHNTAIKYISNFKKIVRIAYANGWIDKDPFFNWKGRLKNVEREFLSEEEIQTIVDKVFSTKRLELVKDIFIFSCFTGLAYADVQKLTSDNLMIGIDGERWINTKRTKTKTTTKIPVLPIAAEILDKYNSTSNSKDKLLPILSNQKMNAYLKEIADICEIQKNLTFHLARHTFATTVTLTNGVPIESVSKMLGHKSLKTTQHYAKILDKKVSEDMQLLKEKLNFNIKKVTSSKSLKSS